MRRIKNKSQVIQNMRMRATLRSKHRKCKRMKNNSKLKQIRVRNSFVDTPRVPRSFRRISSQTSSISLNRNKIDFRKKELIKKYLSPNLKYVTTHEKSPFNLERIRKSKPLMNCNERIEIPNKFSFLDNTEQSIDVFSKMLSALLLGNKNSVTFDYINCNEIDLCTQVIFDIILKEYDKFTKLSVNKKLPWPRIHGGVNMHNESVSKMMWSVGSPSNLGIKSNNFRDVEKLNLQIYDHTKEKDANRRMEKKDIDTTEIAEYVMNSLKKVGKKLTPRKRDDLCNVIGEILINAEEHSTTKHRISCGYFIEKNIKDKHYGLFQLVILNFGQTIYEKFKSEDCPNKDIVDNMKRLSKKYTESFFFIPRKFEEETLWTLYALQEGVTSISTDSYKRGNGSIRFIESFFNIKGSQRDDNISRMTIVSGNTKIVFDGSYSITDGKSSNGTCHKMMTFNKSGSLDDKPDNEYVKHTDYYFPGTMICAELLLNDDDVKKI